MNQLKDRTSEFRSVVESARLRSASTNEVKRPLLADGSGQVKGARSEFARMAAKIGKDIQGTTFKLEKLAQYGSEARYSLGGGQSSKSLGGVADYFFEPVAKRKTLFDDRPVEISELTYIIKQDIAHLNQQIAQLQSFTRSNLNSAVGSKQVSEHNNNVVMMLQSKLADASIGFKDVLEIRTQNMKASRDRTEQFMYTGHTQQGPSSVLRARTVPVSSSLNSDSPLYRAASADPHRKGKGTQPASTNSHTAGNPSSDFLALDLGGPGAQGSGQSEGGYMEMQLAQGQGEDQYLNQRSTAIETIESTVAELGQIFSQLATMIAVQGEQVTRIDADTEEIATNVSGAQTELLKYYTSISSNRWLMMKVPHAQFEEKLED
ncbi:syntaxin 5, partial [Phenoliferia sp. Uapishka_3]